MAKLKTEKFVFAIFHGKLYSIPQSKADKLAELQIYADDFDSPEQGEYRELYKEITTEFSALQTRINVFYP
jgi:hypothetical protein